MTTLTDFLEARLEEDRALAQAAIDDPYGSGDCWFDTSNAFIADHYLRHEPYRVLREVQAKRAILEAVRGLSGQAYDDVEFKVLTSLAEAWRDHPDHPGEWDYDEE